MIKENALAEVAYTKGACDVTERVIIPTYVPQPKHRNVKALDVTALSDEERETVLSAWNDYQDYLEEQRNALFAFDQFVEMTEGKALPELKWRTFKPEQLEET